MARRRYLIAYDIANARRLNRVCKLMEGYGERLQYSVFLCDLSGTEIAHWEASIRTVLDLSADSIVVIDLGLPENSTVRCLGVPRRLPRPGPSIV